MEQIAEGGCGFSLAGDLQAADCQAPDGDALEEFADTDRGLD